MKYNKQNQAKTETLTNSGGTKLVDNSQMLPEEIGKDGPSGSMHARKKYRDVADAAQAAFESAAYAAAAVELSRSGPHDSGNQKSHNGGRNVSQKDEPIQIESQLKNQGIHHENEEEAKVRCVAELKRSVSTSSSETEETSKVSAMSLDAEDPTKQVERDIVFGESDNESDGLHFYSELKGEILSTENSNKKIPRAIQSGLKVNSRHGYSTARDTEGPGIQSSKLLNIETGLISVRTRRVRGF